MPRMTPEDLIDQADIGKGGRAIVMLAGAIAAFLVKEKAESAVKAVLIYRKIKID